MTISRVGTISNDIGACMIETNSDGGHVRAFGPIFKSGDEVSDFCIWLQASPLDFDSRQLQSLLNTFRKARGETIPQ